MSMKKSISRLLIGAGLICGQAIASQTFESGPQRVSLVELYTSQGCSSCPPMEAWMSRMTSSNALWSRLVPVAFHVTYWDSLGWRDRFGDELYDFRQRSYAKLWHNRSVYTPGVVLNGEEWRGWMQRTTLKLPEPQLAGDLHVEVKPGGIDVRFQPPSVARLPLRMNLALLGFGIQTAIEAGENADETLHHDFVVLDYQQGELKSAGQGYGGLYGNLKMPAGVTRPERLAIAAWVSGADDPTPLQAVGGWLADAATATAPQARTAGPGPSDTGGRDKAH